MNEIEIFINKIQENGIDYCLSNQDLKLDIEISIEILRRMDRDSKIRVLNTLKNITEDLEKKVFQIENEKKLIFFEIQKINKTQFACVTYLKNANSKGQ